jgi:hypothetical protein
MAHEYTQAFQLALTATHTRSTGFDDVLAKKSVSGGTVACHHKRTGRPRTPVDRFVICSGRTAVLYRFFTKPWDDEALRGSVRAAFRHYWQLHGMEPDDARPAPP